MSFEIVRPLIPKFKDGEVLSETELYKLAWLPFELNRLANLARGQVGFFCPDDSLEPTWNAVEFRGDQVYVDKLYLVSSEGVAFVSTKPLTLEFDEGLNSGETLFVSLFSATSSIAFNHRLFASSTLVSDSFKEKKDEFGFDDFDEESPQAPVTPAVSSANAYQLLLHWGEDSAPVIEGCNHYRIAMAHYNGSSLELLPKAVYPVALPELSIATSSFLTVLEAYSLLLLEVATAVGLERNDLLLRLEVLEVNLRTPYLATEQLIANAKLMLRVAKGFYLRAAYVQNRNNPALGNLRGLEGRMLEHHLEIQKLEIAGDLRRLLDELEYSLSKLPSTAYEQIQFFKGLKRIFEPSRQEDFLASLNFRVPEPAPISPPQHAPEPKMPRPGPKPLGPRIINLNKDKD